MMSTTFDEMKLQPSFTFRVVEAIKRTKIQAPPSKATLPFGVSVATGLIALVLSMTIPLSPLYPIGTLIGSALPSQTQVPEVGVIPVDVVNKYLDKITSLFFNYLLLVILRSAAKPVPSLRSRTSSKLAAGKNLMS